MFVASCTHTLYISIPRGDLMKKNDNMTQSYDKPTKNPIRLVNFKVEIKKT